MRGTNLYVYYTPVSIETLQNTNRCGRTKYDKHFEMHIYDTWGLEPSTQKAELWKKKIFDEIARHDKESISEWFNTIIFCLNAKSSRIEDFELDIMEKLLREAFEDGNK